VCVRPIVLWRKLVTVGNLTTKPRIASPRPFDASWIGFQTNNLLPGFTLLCISSRSHLLSWPPIRNTESAAWLIACSTLNNLRWKHAGPGPGLLCSLASCLGLGDILSACSSDENSCAAQSYLARYLSLLHCILSRANCSWAFCSVSCTVESGSVAKYFFGISSRLGWGRNIRAVMSDHEASAKASAHLAVIAKPTRVTCRDLACQE